MLCLCGCHYPDHADDCPGAFYFGTMADVIRWETAQKHKRLKAEQDAVVARSEKRTKKRSIQPQVNQ